MAAKVTLITPPDIYQNDQVSVLFIDVTEKEQDEITLWLSEVEKLSLNIYFYQGEPNVPWLLHSLSSSHYRYINLNNMSAVTSHLVGYIVAKPGVYYTIDDINLAELYSHINVNRVNNVVEFLKRVFGGKE
jgi:hypothetical protein